MAMRTCIISPINISVAILASWIVLKWSLGDSTIYTHIASSDEALSPNDGIYIWPSRHDYLEDFFSLRSGYFVNVFSDETRPCSFGETSLGRQNAAEWIRTAFHDLITHDALSAIGGLDASIIFELDRPGNVETKASFETTLHFMSLFHTPRSSIADLLALGVYVSLANCGGPRIPLRLGRRDATKSDPPGRLLPSPEQGLETHRSIFKRAGFSEQDMIALVACGHTLGGVHRSSFPHITDPDETTANIPKSGVVHFERENESFARFDNTAVLEYLSGNGSNLLVYGRDKRFNSDKRIFAADKNDTVRALASAPVFQDRCADVFGRMLNLVPHDSERQLSNALKPVDVKPYIREQSLNKDGSINFSGRIRVQTGSPTMRSSKDLKVSLLILDRFGVGTTTIVASRSIKSAGISLGYFGEEFTWFEFSTTLRHGRGMTSFKLQLTRPSTGEIEIKDNFGHGYPASDDLLYLPRYSCLDSTVEDGRLRLRVAAAMRKGSNPPPSLSLHLWLKVKEKGVPIPVFKTTSIPFHLLEVDVGDYLLYEVVTFVDLLSWNIRFDITSSTGAAVKFQPTNVLRSSKICDGSAQEYWTGSLR
ncbi:wsc domain-containing protein [Pyrenophora teres f. maculata]|nr:wsc domain-containing protein [Pyrenophora teres f. maculata]